jgi:hypothetical protein
MTCACGCGGAGGDPPVALSFDAHHPSITRAHLVTTIFKNDPPMTTKGDDDDTGDDDDD